MRVGLVGCGTISRMHLNALQAMPDVTIAGLADINIKRAEAAAKTYGGTAYASLEEMLDTCKPEVLHICTPHYLHVPMIEEAAKRGIPVFTEKPPAMNREQFARLEVCAGQIPIGICFQNRYNETTQYIKKVMKEQDTGQFLGGKAFVTWKRTKEYYLDSGWRGRRETEGGGALINQSIHTLDLLAYLLGAPQSVEARMQNFHLKNAINVEDTVEAYMTYPDASVLFYATTAYCTDSPVYMELVFEHVSIRLGKDEVKVVYPDHEEVFTADGSFGGPKGKGYWGNGHMACISDYYDALTNGRKIPIGVPEVETTMHLMYDIYESAGRLTKSPINTSAGDTKVSA